MHIKPILAALLLLVATACDDSPAVKAQAGTKLPVWPPVSDGTKVELAKNLLADIYLVLLDNSGSMTNQDCSGNLSKFDLARKALKGFARSIPLEANLSLMVFTSSGARVVVPFGAGTAHRDKFNHVLDSLQADTGTPLRGALRDAYKVMTEQAHRQLGYGLYRLDIVTDGESGDGDPANTAKEIARTPIEVSTIGFCMGKGHSLNVPGYTRYYTAGSPKELFEGLKAMQAEVPVFDVSTFSKN
ncbi:MAG: VWA domain-containing protein [bacterium]|nr:VWA domain-containing protein [bacterium]